MIGTETDEAVTGGAVTGELRVRVATTAELAQWDAMVAQNPAGGDFVLTQPYAATKAAVGWIPRHLVFERAGARVSVALVLERRLPLLGHYWYLPHGPAVSDVAEAGEHIAALGAYARAQHPRVFAVTVEPPILAEDAAAALARESRSAGSPADAGALFAAQGAHGRPALQGNASTAIVQLLDDDAAMLASFQKRCRNSISRALRDGAEVREYPTNAETFAHMHRLMTLVGGGGQTLRLRSHDYAERFWREFSEAGLGRFYGVEVGGSPALLAYVVRVGDRAFYKDGGSERERTSPGMSNLLQWHMMRAMRDAGACSYDLMGTPSRARLSDPSSPNFTLAAFKLSFAGEVTEFVSAYDLPLRPRRYRLWQRFGLPIAQRLHRRRYRDLDLY